MKVHAIYRSTGSDNQKSRPPYYDKTLCLLSFMRAVQQCREPVEVIFLNDGPIPDERLRIMSAAGEVMALSGVGNFPSKRAALSLIDWRRWEDSDLLYMAEDDYLYLPEALDCLVAAAKEIPQASYFSLYDFPRYDNLGEQAYDRGKTRVFIGGARHWRLVASTPDTFGARIEAMRADAWLHWLGTRSPQTGSPFIRRDKQLPAPSPVHAIWNATQGLGPYQMVHAIIHRMGFMAGIPKDRVIRRFRLGRALRGRLRSARTANRLLIAPLPSLATHLELPHVSPLVDWAAVAAQTSRWAEENFQAISGRDGSRGLRPEEPRIVTP
jgi:hypothetical protein